MSTTTTSKATPEQVAAALGFIAKAADAEFTRDDAPDGAHHNIRATVAIQVDGSTVIAREWEGTVDVGHSSVRASSVGAKAGEVLAYVAAKMNTATREALYRELADVFAANGGRLPVTEAAVKEADEALAKLRQKTEQTVRGNFKATARLVAEPATTQPATQPATVDAEPLNISCADDLLPAPPVATSRQTSPRVKSRATTGASKSKAVSRR